MDVQCWDEHHITASSLIPGQLVLLSNIYVKMTPTKLRLVLHGNIKDKKNLNCKIEAIDQSKDSRCAQFNNQKALFFERERFHITSSSICASHSTLSDIHNSKQSLFLIRAQFLDIPPPSTWFYYVCLSCKAKTNDTKSLPTCCSLVNIQVFCEFKCKLYLMEGELEVLCKDQGILDFLGSSHPPKSYVDNLKLLDQLETRVKNLSSPHLRKFCDVTLRRFEKRNDNSSNFSIVYTTLL
ncbi:hypothetical protein HMI54_007910 [Coelomomyces lativittatus]|nr:hypothetical protein HMI54_007910 [Coelomomyces lativittatus]